MPDDGLLRKPFVQQLEGRDRSHPQPRLGGHVTGRLAGRVPDHAGRHLVRPAFPPDGVAQVTVSVGSTVYVSDPSPVSTVSAMPSRASIESAAAPAS